MPLVKHTIQLLVLSVLFSYCTFGHTSAETAHQPQWQSIQQTLDCDGTKVVIDAVTDTAIPSQGAELLAADRPFTVEELRQLVVLVSPENANAAYQTILGSGFALYDDASIFIASAADGQVGVSFPEAHTWYVKASSTSHGVQYEEPFATDAPSLQYFNANWALQMVSQALVHTDYEIGQPSHVTVWSVDTLQDGLAKYNQLVPDHALNHSWTAADEVYQIAVPVYYNSIRLHCGNRRLVDSLMIADAGISCVVRQDKILQLSIAHCTFSTVEKVTAAAPFLTVDEAIACYQPILSAYVWTIPQDVVIHKILLEYIVQLNDQTDPYTYQLVPAWCFYYKLYDADLQCYEEHADAIHAVTGQHIDI